MTIHMKEIKRKVTHSGELTAIEKRTVLTLIERWGHPAKWDVMTEGYIVCSHCHNESDGRKPTPYCPTCGALMKQPDWYRPEEEIHDYN